MRQLLDLLRRRPGPPVVVGDHVTLTAQQYRELLANSDRWMFVAPLFEPNPIGHVRVNAINAGAMLGKHGADRIDWAMRYCE